MYRQLHHMVLRADRPADAPDLRRLAALDSARAPLQRPRHCSPRSRAAPSPPSASRTASVVADPFEHTADVVELLRFRAERREAPRSRTRVLGRFRTPSAA